MTRLEAQSAEVMYDHSGQGSPRLSAMMAEVAYDQSGAGSPRLSGVMAEVMYGPAAATGGAVLPRVFGDPAQSAMVFQELA